MERFFEFMGNHPFLFGMMGVLIIAFFSIETKRGGKKISPNTVGLMVNNDNAKIIDIRPKKDFDKGHIKGSRNIPFTDLKNQLEELRNINQPLIVVCQMGVTAGTAIAMIAKDNVYRLDGGVMGWQSAGLPLVTEKTVNG